MGADDALMVEFYKNMAGTNARASDVADMPSDMLVTTMNKTIMLG